jgi:hypothetical protein
MEEGERKANKKGVELTIMPLLQIIIIINVCASLNN